MIMTITKDASHALELERLNEGYRSFYVSELDVYVVLDRPLKAEMLTDDTLVVSVQSYASSKRRKKIGFNA